jgi:hypothetical protein
MCIQGLVHFSPLPPSLGYFHHTHFIDEETRALSFVSFPKSHS